MPKNAVVEPPKSDEKIAKVEAGWYWFGLLPAVGPVDYLMPKGVVASADVTRDEFETISTDAYRLWMRLAHRNLTSFPVFVGKCRQYNSLPSHGCEFPAFCGISEVTEQGGSIFYYPGNARLFRLEEAEAVVRGCWQYYLHYPDGVDSAQRPDAAHPEIRNSQSAIRPAGMTDEDWREAIRNQRGVQNIRHIFDPYSDRWVADCVYFVRLDLPIHPPELDEKLYKKNVNGYANRFHESVIPARLDRNFFSTPPKSVSETYVKPEA